MPIFFFPDACILHMTSITLLVSYRGSCFDAIMRLNPPPAPHRPGSFAIFLSRCLGWAFFARLPRFAIAPPGGLNRSGFGFSWMASLWSLGWMVSPTPMRVQFVRPRPEAFAMGDLLANSGLAVYDCAGRRPSVECDRKRNGNPASPLTFPSLRL